MSKANYILLHDYIHNAIMLFVNSGNNF